VAEPGHELLGRARALLACLFGRLGRSPHEVSEGHVEAHGRALQLGDLEPSRWLLLLGKARQVTGRMADDVLCQLAVRERVDGGLRQRHDARGRLAASQRVELGTQVGAVLLGPVADG